MQIAHNKKKLGKFPSTFEIKDINKFKKVTEYMYIHTVTEYIYRQR